MKMPIELSKKKSEYSVYVYGALDIRLFPNKSLIVDLKNIEIWVSHGLKGRGYRRGLLLHFSGNFFYLNIYKYVQKLAQNYICWSNFRDFISCIGQNTCKKGTY